MVQILKESRYHSSEWEETDPEEDWTILQPEVIEDETTEVEAIKEKTTSLYVYEKWWRSSSVCIFYIIYFLIVILMHLQFLLLNINSNLINLFI